MTEAQKRYLGLVEEARYIATLYRDEIEQTRAQIIEEGCTHPVTCPYIWEWDSGYGRQKMIEGLRCVFCRATKGWKNMGIWSKTKV